MPDTDTAAGKGDGRRWFIVTRWQEYEGEARANLLRIAGIGAFYLVEIANYHGLRLGFIELPQVVDKPFHQAVTALAVAWAMVAMGVLVCLRQQFFPAVLKYISTGADVVLLTAILVVADGPKSPLVVGYFLLIVLATLRLSLPLVRFATVASAGGYLFLLAYARWFASDLRVARYHQIIFLLGLVLTGVVLGQVIRRVQRLAEDYASRARSAQGDVP
jgi:hypothetical protein